MRHHYETGAVTVVFVGGVLFSLSLWLYSVNRKSHISLFTTKRKQPMTKLTVIKVCLTVKYIKHEKLGAV